MGAMLAYLARLSMQVVLPLQQALAAGHHKNDGG